MKPSDWKAPEPTTVSSAILFHCATVFPGGNAAVASRVVPADAATASATATITAARRTFVLFGFMGFHLLWSRRHQTEPGRGWSPFVIRRIFEERRACTRDTRCGAVAPLRRRCGQRRRGSAVHVRVPRRARRSYPCRLGELQRARSRAPAEPPPCGLTGVRIRRPG